MFKALEGKKKRAKRKAKQKGLRMKLEKKN
jgi:hypothetical protein